MADDKDDHQLGDFDNDDDGVGFSYRRVDGGGTSTPLQRLFKCFKSPYTMLLLLLIFLVVGVLVLQAVQIVMGQSCASSAQMDQLNANQESLATQKNDTDKLQAVYSATQSAAQRLTGIVHSLSNIESSGTTTKGAVDDILLVAEELLKLQNKSLIFSSHLPVSCQDIKKYDPASPSGYYHINSQLVYCEMEELCGSSDGWTRIGYLDMSDETVKCPTGFRYYSGSGIRGCGRPWGGPSCASTKLQPNGISYSEVCGKVIGYQKGSPDAVDTRFVDPSIHNDIDKYYVDGVSITYGSNPRKHIWTFMAGVFQSYDDDGDCPCNDPPGDGQEVQSFIGKNYFCESGNPTHAISGGSYYAVDPLWDGKGCGQKELKCCDDSLGLPWFHRKINTTAEAIEVRECGDQAVGDEDVLINLFDIYVK